MSNSNGFIKIDRKILEWGWYTDLKTQAVWINILLNANWKTGYFYGLEIKPGQWLTSYSKIANNLQISLQNVRSAIFHLKSTGELTYQPTRYGILITVIKWEDYQLLEEPANRATNTPTNREVTGNQQGSNREVTPIEEGKKERREERKKKDKEIMSDSGTTSEAEKEIIDWLNNRTGSHFRYSKASIRHIQARLNEGYTVQDFKDVIDKKCVEWLHDEKMSKFLCPDTLFGNKFEKYLNQPAPVKQEDFLERELRKEHAKNEQRGNSEDPDDSKSSLFNF